MSNSELKTYKATFFFQGSEDDFCSVNTTFYKALKESMKINRSYGLTVMEQSPTQPAAVNTLVIREFVEYIIKNCCANTNEGNWVTFAEELPKEFICALSLRYDEADDLFIGNDEAIRTAVRMFFEYEAVAEADIRITGDVDITVYDDYIGIENPLAKARKLDLGTILFWCSENGEVLSAEVVALRKRCNTYFELEMDDGVDELLRKYGGGDVFGEIMFSTSHIGHIFFVSAEEARAVWERAQMLKSVSPCEHNIRIGDMLYWNCIKSGLIFQGVVFCLSDPPQRQIGEPIGLSYTVEVQMISMYNDPETEIDPEIDDIAGFENYFYDFDCYQEFYADEIGTGFFTTREDAVKDYITNTQT